MAIKKIKKILTVRLYYESYLRNVQLNAAIKVTDMDRMSRNFVGSKIFCFIEI